MLLFQKVAVYSETFDFTCHCFTFRMACTSLRVIRKHLSTKECVLKENIIVNLIRLERILTEERMLAWWEVLLNWCSLKLTVRFIYFTLHVGVETMTTNAAFLAVRIISCWVTYVCFLYRFSNITLRCTGQCQTKIHRTLHYKHCVTKDHEYALLVLV